MLDDLKAFVAVVDRASVTRAADTLAITQSAVSRRIQQLEDALGVKLLDRSTKPPTTTAVGQRIYQAATPLLRDLDRLIGIPRQDEEPSGTFRFGLPQVVADVALFEIAKQVKAAFPALELKCRTEWSSALQRELSNGQLDAAALMLPARSPQPPGMHAQFVTSLEVLVVQSKHRPIAPKNVRMAEIAEHEWILNPQGCGYRAAIQRALEGAGKQVRLGVDTHGTEIQLRLVAEGLGLGLAPRSLLAQSSYSHELSVIDVADFNLKLDIWLVSAIELGNLRRAHMILSQVLSDCFASLSFPGKQAAAQKARLSDSDKRSPRGR